MILPLLMAGCLPVPAPFTVALSNAWVIWKGAPGCGRNRKAELVHRSLWVGSPASSHTLIIRICCLPPLQPSTFPGDSVGSIPRKAATPSSRHAHARCVEVVVSNSPDGTSAPVCPFRLIVRSHECPRVSRRSERDRFARARSSDLSPGVPSPAKMPHSLSVDHYTCSLSRVGPKTVTTSGAPLHLTGFLSGERIFCTSS